MGTVTASRRSASLSREDFRPFRDWLIRQGWTIENTLSRAEILRASKKARPDSRTKKFIFGYDSHDQENLLFFDDAADLVNRFQGAK